MRGGSSSDNRAERRGILPLLKDFRRRVITLWQLKAWLLLTVSVAFSVPYFLLGNYPLLPVHDLPMTWIDRTIGLHPEAWVWVYQSFYLPVNFVPWLAERRDDLLRYVKGFAIVSLLSFLVYFVYPVRSPARITPHPTAMQRMLLAYDAPLNALPSLHAGLLVYTLAFGWRILRGTAPRWLAAGAVVWGGLILYSTLATKEHYTVDIIAGAALALGADSFVWRGHGRVAHHTHRESEDS
jgi:hypothetical protein